MVSLSLDSRSSSKVSVSAYEPPSVFFKNGGEPAHRSLPLLMTHTLSHNRSASSKKCVVSTTHRPFAAARISLHASRLDLGSKPLVGSSSNTTLEGPMSAIAICSRRFIPPESVTDRASAFCSNPTSRSFFATSRSTSREGTPFRTANMRRCSAHVNAGKRTFCCGHTPRHLRHSASDPSSECPATMASPPEGGVSPVSMAIVVLLPAPLGPRRPVTCPSYSATLSGDTASTGPPPPFQNAAHEPFGLNVLRKPWITTAGRTEEVRDDILATPSNATGSSATPSFAAFASAARANASIPSSPPAPSPLSSSTGVPRSNSADRHPAAIPPPLTRPPSPNSSPAPAPGPRQYLAENTNHHGSGVPCAVGNTFPRYHAIAVYSTASPTMMPMSSPSDSGSSYSVAHVTPRSAPSLLASRSAAKVKAVGDKTLAALLASSAWFSYV